MTHSDSRPETNPGRSKARPRRRGVFTILALLALAPLAFAAEPWLRSLPDHPTGRYKSGEKITWTIKKEDGAMPDSWKWQVLKNGVPPAIASGTVDLAADATVTCPAEGMGWMFLVLTEDPAQGKPRVFNGGALVDDGQIRTTAKEPADFDAYWKDQLKRLAAIPMNPVLTTNEGTPAGFLLGKLELDNINGTHVRGYWAKPEGDGPFPAVVQYQYAGVYPLQKDWALGHARRGYLALNIIAHDLPVDEPPEFYKQQDAGPLKGYMGLGNTNRDTTYVKRMFLGTRRAIDWVVTRPDWNRKVLLVTGTSQGGFQSFAAAGLSPEVTHLCVNVPAGCDLSAGFRGLYKGWPGWGWAPDSLRAQVEECASYYEPCFFAARTRAHCLVAVGLIDTTSPATHVLAAFNALRGDKQLISMPDCPHTGRHNEARPFNEASGRFFEEIKK